LPLVVGPLEVVGLLEELGCTLGAEERVGSLEELGCTLGLGAEERLGFTNPTLGG
jgi:hypothetical protein